MRRRDISSGLNDRRWKEADIRPMEVIGPGPGGTIRLRPPGATQEVLASVASGRTYAPGEEVPVGSFSGLPGTEFVIGDPPPGRGGGSRFPQVTYPPGPPAVPHDYLAMIADVGEAELVAWAYTDGKPLYELSRIGWAPDEAAGFSIGPDGRLLFLEVLGGDSVGVRVWDTAGDQVLEYDPPVDWQCSFPLWLGALAAWVEYPLGLTSKPSTVRFVVADSALAAATVRGTLVIEFEDDEAGGPGAVSFNWAPLAIASATSLSYASPLTWSWDGGSLTGDRTVHFTVAGVGSEIRGASFAHRGVQWAARSLRAEGGGGSEAMARGDGILEDYAVIWPALPDSITNLSHSAGEVVAYTSAFEVHRGPEAGASRVFTVDPADGDEPTLFFAMPD